MHGAGGSIRTWKRQENGLHNDYNLLLIDLRDHGLSKSIEPNYKTYSFQLISEDIIKVMDLVNIAEAHFITLSFGSVLLQDLTMRYPHRVKSLVLAGGIFRGTLPIRLFVNLAQFMNYFLSYEFMYNLFSYLLMPYSRNKVARKIYQQQAMKLSQKEYMKWVGLYREFFRLLQVFYNQPLDVPVLIIMGGDDYMFLSGAKRFASKKSAKIEIIPKCGHICNIEAPEYFNQKVSAFINQVAG